MSATSSWKSSEPDDRGSSLQEPLRTALGAAPPLQTATRPPYLSTATATSGPHHNTFSGLAGGDIAPEWAGRGGGIAASGFSSMGAREMSGEEHLRQAHQDASLLSSRHLPGAATSGANFDHLGASEGRQEPTRSWRRDPTPERNSTLGAPLPPTTEQVEKPPVQGAAGSQVPRAQWEGTGSTGAGAYQSSSAVSGAYPSGDAGVHHAPRGTWGTASSAAGSALAPASGPAPEQAAEQFSYAQRLGLLNGGPEYGSSNALGANGAWAMSTQLGPADAADAPEGMGNDGQLAVQDGGFWEQLSECVLPRPRTIHTLTACHLRCCLLHRHCRGFRKGTTKGIARALEGHQRAP